MHEHDGITWTGKMCVQNEIKYTDIISSGEIITDLIPVLLWIQALKK